MPLIQLHWQWIEKCQTIKTEMRAQKEINSNNEMYEFIKEVEANHPLPEKAIWLVCTEKSEFFMRVKAIKDETNDNT